MSICIPKKQFDLSFTYIYNRTGGPSLMQQYKVWEIDLQQGSNLLASLWFDEIEMYPMDFLVYTKLKEEKQERCYHWWVAFYNLYLKLI